LRRAGLLPLVGVALGIAVTVGVARSSAASTALLAGRIVGTVRTEAHVPVRGASIAIVPGGRGATQVPDIAILTNRRGRYVGPVLHPGRYRVRVYAARYRVPTKYTLVRSGREALVNFTLRLR
jgi:Carboxypeptidase regulatory-like domain